MSARLELALKKVPLAMKRLIASAVALGVLAAPAVATTRAAAPAKVTKQVKKSTRVASAKTARPTRTRTK